MKRWYSFFCFLFGAVLSAFSFIMAFAMLFVRGNGYSIILGWSMLAWGIVGVFVTRSYWRDWKKSFEICKARKP